MLNDLALKRRLLAEDGDIILDGEAPSDLDRSRQLAARDEREILLDSDATENQIAQLVTDSGLDEVSARMRDEAEAILQPLPASYNPDPAKRSEIDVWVEPQEGLICLGVTRDATADELVVRAARMLARLLEIDGGKDDAVAEALITSFSLRLAARHGHHEVVSRRLNHVIRLLQLEKVSREPSKTEETEAGVLLWACLTAVKAEEHSFIRSHVQRFSPVAAWVAQRLAARSGDDLPDDAASGARLRAIIEAVLSAPELESAAPSARARRERADKPRSSEQHPS